VSQPRQILSNATYLITRRTILRHMLLRPDGAMTEMLVYLLAVYAERMGMKVHAVCAMSTHIHLVVTDVDRKLPEFLQAFHRTVARCTMALRAWDTTVWDNSPTSVVRLETRVAVVEKIAYVLANPVAAGLVEHAHEWPGAKVLVEQVTGATLSAARPEVYLNPKNWPAEARLDISLPPVIDASEADVFREQVATELARLERQARAEVREQGREFLGAEPARTVPPTARATKEEPMIDRNPTFAVGRGQGDDWLSAVAKVRGFRAAYRSALEQWRAGIRDVVFPVGTWSMGKFHGALVDGLVAAG
jgi:REP element-mobilizing transposase RayT